MQYDRGDPVRPQSGKDAKAAPSPKSRVCAGQMQQLMESNGDADVRAFDSYAEHIALSPKGQAEVARRVREDAERNAATQAAIENKRQADERERERVEKERIEKELKAVTATKLKVHRSPQQGEHVEYQVLRMRPDLGEPWPTYGEILEILRKEPRASGTVYGTHFSIRFSLGKIVPTT